MSPSQRSLLHRHINLVIDGGITDQAVPSIVNGHEIPPSFLVMHALKDGFNIVMFSNTHNNQEQPYTIHKSMGIRLVLRYGMSLIWNGFLLHCGGRSRQTKYGCHLNDLRWFNYYWTSVLRRCQKYK